MTRLAWLLLGHAALIFGVIGIFLPILPTTPFLLVASFAYSRGSPRFEAWLLNHRRLGPVVRDWRAHGIISRRAKWLATVMMMASCAYVVTKVEIPLIGKGAMLAVFILVLAFIWTRPEGVG